MKSHVVLLGKVLEDSSIWCHTSTVRDLKTVTDRVEHEGLSFLTITLPAFGADFERGLDRGHVSPSDFLGFKRVGSLPAFMRGLTGLVFDTSTGILLDEPSKIAIQCIRQVCYLFKKLEVPCSDARVTAAFDKYVECEQAVRLSDASLEMERKFDFMRMTDRVFQRFLTTIDNKVYCGEVTPKHGPGATADRLKANAKFDNRLWTDRLEEVFQSDHFLFPSPSHYYDSINEDAVSGPAPTYLEPGDEIPVRVITVPKTLKTPRIIAIEPTHMQYVQQGMMQLFVEGIERDDLLSSFIGFTDQTMNRDLACKASANGDLATLDLSEASDRVSNLHVKLLLSQRPVLLNAVQACRSLKADVPGYGVLPLAKFASMGSALTFPIEAMVFLIIILIGIERELKMPMTHEILKDLVGKVRVYGDDIIVPVHFVDSVIRELEAFGLCVNGNKSFWTGKFRESCGGDFYDGFDVNVVKVRRVLPTSRKHVSEIESLVSLRNQMYFSGYWATAKHLDDMIERLIPFPSVHPDSPCLGRHTFLDYEVQRECPNLQRPLVKGAVVVDHTPRSDVSGVGALLKFFLRAERNKEDSHPLDFLFPPEQDKNHLIRAGRPVSSDIKHRWVPPY